MKQIAYILVAGLLLITNYGVAQTIERQVIGSAGSFVTDGATMTISFTVGEPIVQTVSNSPSFILTQGFQQPDTDSAIFGIPPPPIVEPSSIISEIINESCLGLGNGSIRIISVPNCPAPYSVVISLPGDTAVQDLASLSAGTYNATISSADAALACSVVTTITVGLDSEESCLLKIYSGLTPNGDGNNDLWIIDGIEDFPINTVKIVNRWGSIVWERTDYNNMDIVWEGRNNGGEDLPDGTYFYIVDIGDGNIYKGWVEVTR